MASTALQIDALWAGLNDPDTGRSYSGAIVATFATDGTTPKAVWEDKDKTLPDAGGKAQFNLDANGQAEVFGDGVYVIKVYDSTDTGLSSPRMTIDSATYINPEGSLVSGVDSVSDLRAGSGGESDGEVVELTGYYTYGDGGGQSLFWNASSTTADNGVTVFEATPATGRWESVIPTPVTAKQAGAKGDGSTDDSTAINAASSWLNSLGGGELFFPRSTGAYMAENLIVHKHCIWRGEGVTSGIVDADQGSIIKLIASSSNPLIMSNSYANDLTTQDYSIRFENLGFAGNKGNGATGEIMILSASQTRIVNCRIDYGGSHGVVFSAFTQDGVTEVAYCGQNVISGCNIIRNEGNGVYGIDSTSNNLADTIITGGCSIGWNGTGNSAYRNISLERGAGTIITGNNIFRGGYGNILMLAGNGSISNNYIEDNEDSVASGTYTGCDFRVADNTGLSVNGNYFYTSRASAVGGVTYVQANIGLATDGSCVITGNTFTSPTITAIAHTSTAGTDDQLFIGPNSYNANITKTLPNNSTGINENVLKVLAGNATLSDNFMITPSQENMDFIGGISPSGTEDFVKFDLYSDSDVDNSAYLSIQSNQTGVFLKSLASGTGTAQPMQIGSATNQIGFFASNGTTKQTVTGSAGGNAALASLLTILENHGLIVDSST